MKRVTHCFRIGLRAVGRFSALSSERRMGWKCPACISFKFCFACLMNSPSASDVLFGTHVLNEHASVLNVGDVTDVASRALFVSLFFSAPLLGLASNCFGFSGAFAILCSRCRCHPFQSRSLKPRQQFGTWSMWFSSCSIVTGWSSAYVSTDPPVAQHVGTFIKHAGGDTCT